MQLRLRISSLLPVLRVFRHVGGAFEFQAIAVRIGDGSYPQAVADEWAGDLDVARSEFVIKGDGVLAHEADRDANTQLLSRHIRVWTIGHERLQHDPYLTAL